MIEIRIVLSVIARLQIVEIDEALVVDRQKRDVETILFEMLAGVENRFVFGDARDDVIALFAIHPGDAFHRQIVGFRRAAREDDFPWIGANQCGNFFARRLDGLFRFPAELVVAACGIAETDPSGTASWRQARADRAESSRDCPCK